MADGQAEVMEGQPCPMCTKNTLTLTEAEKEVPFFGKMVMFSMTCAECKYHKADIEALEKQDPVKWTIEINDEKDLNTRVVKSAEATVKIPHITTIDPGPAANGYITTIEGIFKRVIHQVETLRDSSEEKEDKKKAKNMLKKINKIMWGQQTQKIIIEDPTGNSAIISEKAEKGKLKA